MLFVQGNNNCFLNGLCHEDEKIQRLMTLGFPTHVSCSPMRFSSEIFQADSKEKRILLCLFHPPPPLLHKNPAHSWPGAHHLRYPLLKWRQEYSYCLLNRALFEDTKYLKQIGSFFLQYELSAGMKTCAGRETEK